MPRFEVGDVIKCVDQQGFAGRLTLGKHYTIVEDKFSKADSFLEQPSGPYGHPVTVLADNGTYSTFYSFQFELVDQNESFNISIATDQELADEYRRMLKERYPVHEELRQRGYRIADDNGKTLGQVAEFVTITKMEKVSL